MNLLSLFSCLSRDDSSLMVIVFFVVPFGESEKNNDNIDQIRSATLFYTDLAAETVSNGKFWVTRPQSHPTWSNARFKARFYSNFGGQSQERCAMFQSVSSQFLSVSVGIVGIFSTKIIKVWVMTCAPDRAQIMMSWPDRAGHDLV